MGWNQVPNWVGGVIVHPRGVILQTRIVHWSFVPLLRSITEAPCVPLFGGFLNVSFRIFDEIFVYTTQQQEQGENNTKEWATTLRNNYNNYKQKRTHGATVHVQCAIDDFPPGPIHASETTATVLHKQTIKKKTNNVRD